MLVFPVCIRCRVHTSTHSLQQMFLASTEILYATGRRKQNEKKLKHTEHERMHSSLCLVLRCQLERTFRVSAKLINTLLRSVCPFVVVVFLSLAHVRWFGPACADENWRRECVCVWRRCERQISELGQRIMKAHQQICQRRSRRIEKQPSRCT